MGELIRFDVLREQYNIVAYRLTPEQNVCISSETLVAELSEKDPRFLCVRPFQMFVVPQGNMWYAISLRCFRLDLGYQEILPYRLKEWPNQLFNLGFNCSMQLHVSHITGLVKCIQGRPTLDERSLRKVIRDGTLNMIREVMRNAALLYPEFEELVKKTVMIENLAEHQIFPVLYDLGLCMGYQSFHIQSFATPSLAIDNWR